MRLYRLEIKRVLKARRTLILLAVALIMSVVMAYLPIMFESINLKFCPNFLVVIKWNKIYTSYHI